MPTYKSHDHAHKSHDMTTYLGSVAALPGPSKVSLQLEGWVWLICRDSRQATCCLWHDNVHKSWKEKGSKMRIRPHDKPTVSSSLENRRAVMVPSTRMKKAMHICMHIICMHMDRHMHAHGQLDTCIHMDSWTHVMLVWQAGRHTDGRISLEGKEALGLHHNPPPHDSVTIQLLFKVCLDLSPPPPTISV